MEIVEVPAIAPESEGSESELRAQLAASREEVAALRAELERERGTPRGESDVHAQLGIPCADGGFCTAPPGDKLYCFLAERLGYDSIQVARSHFNGRPEMVVCRGKCMTVRCTCVSASARQSRAP